MTEAKFLKLLKEYIFNIHGTQKEAAEHWGVSCAYISLVVTGVKPPNGIILRDIGFTTKRETIRTYTRK